MTLETWRTNGWLTPYQASRQEIEELIHAAGRDIADAGKDISPAWRFAIAYNAALRLCTALLQAAGYRATREQKHYRTIAALPLILGSDAAELALFLDRCRARRHEVTYESLSSVSKSEARELIHAAVELEGRVRSWLASR